MYSRVTLASGERRVDLAVPSSLPLADVFPQLLRYCAPAERADDPKRWTLARLGGPTIGLSQTLADAGVLDGEVLELQPRAGSSQVAYVEDVRDAVEDEVDAAGRQWSRRTTLGFALVAAGAGTSLAMVLPEVRRTHDTGALVSAAAVTSLLVFGAWWSSRRIAAAGHVLVAAGCLWGGLAGWLAGAWFVPTSRWTAAAAGAVAVAIAARLLTPLATPYLAGLAVATSAVIAADRLEQQDAMLGPRVLGTLAVLTIGVLPRVSLTAGGLAAADYRVRSATPLTQEQLVRRIAGSARLLHGALYGVAATGAAAGVALALAPSTWDRLLGLAVGLGLVMRSRLFSRIQHVAPLRVAGLVVVLAEALPPVRDVATLGPWLALVAAGAAAALVAASATPLSDITRARVKQLLNLAEYVVVIAMIALAGGALGAFRFAADLMGLTS